MVFEWTFETDYILASIDNHPFVTEIIFIHHFMNSTELNC